MPPGAYLTRDRIARDTAAAFAAEHEGAAGAVVSFLGVVRADHEGTRHVHALRYEGYEGMAQVQVAQLIRDALRRWSLHAVQVQHRLGRVPVGEVALAAMVAAAHREEAFAALRFLVEGIKRDAPIWKQTHYHDGTQAWSGCPEAGVVTPQERPSHAVV